MWLLNTQKVLALLPSCWEGSVGVLLSGIVQRHNICHHISCKIHLALFLLGINLTFTQVLPKKKDA